MSALTVDLLLGGKESLRRYVAKVETRRREEGVALRFRIAPGLLLVLEKAGAVFLALWAVQRMEISG